VASPYPVVISLETRCSSEQQVVMSKIFREVLGDSMVIAPVSEGETRLPSPASLIHKIIVKVSFDTFFSVDLDAANNFDDILLFQS
jgi:phosphatidylinositol phospholipase C delta